MKKKTRKVMIHMTDEVYDGLVKFSNKFDKSLSSSANFIVESRLFFLGYIELPEAESDPPRPPLPKT